MTKEITIKVYRPTGEFLAIWHDATFETFTKRINGGLGECVIKLARKWDDYDEYVDVKLNNEVQILINDKDTIATTDGYVKIYSGYISRYEPWVDGGEEGVTVTCLGYYTKLAQDILKNNVTTTLYADSTAGLTTSSPGDAADVGLIMRGIIDRYIAETTVPIIHYSKAGMPNTSTTALYTFEMMTYQEAIDIVRSLAPANYWWYVNEYNEFLFKTKPTIATHRFIFGKHFSKVSVEKSMEKTRNALLFWNTKTGVNQIYKLYTDAASIIDYDRRLEKLIDQDRVGSSTDADKIGQGFVSEHKNPDIKVTVEILDNNYTSKGYDIESISPGDTCNFLGFKDSLNETFKENMLITEVEYTLYKAIVTIEPMSAGVINRIEEVAKKVDNINTRDTPPTYSV